VSFSNSPGLDERVYFWALTQCSEHERFEREVAGGTAYVLRGLEVPDGEGDWLDREDRAFLARHAGAIVHGALPRDEVAAAASLDLSRAVVAYYASAEDLEAAWAERSGDNERVAGFFRDEGAEGLRGT
jgi:hypothetical protein